MIVNDEKLTKCKLNNYLSVVKMYTTLGRFCNEGYLNILMKNLNKIILFLSNSNMTTQNLLYFQDYKLHLCIRQSYVKTAKFL